MYAVLILKMILRLQELKMFNKMSDNKETEENNSQLNQDYYKFITNPRSDDFKIMNKEFGYILVRELSRVVKFNDNSFYYYDKNTRLWHNYTDLDMTGVFYQALEPILYSLESRINNNRGGSDYLKFKKKFKSIKSKIGKVYYMKKIIKEIRDEFIDPEFVKRLDKNPLELPIPGGKLLNLQTLQTKKFKYQ